MGKLETHRGNTPFNYNSVDLLIPLQIVQSSAVMMFQTDSQFMFTFFITMTEWNWKFTEATSTFPSEINPVSLSNFIFMWGWKGRLEKRERREISRNRLEQLRGLASLKSVKLASELETLERLDVTVWSPKSANQRLSQNLFSFWKPVFHLDTVAWLGEARPQCESQPFTQSPLI